MSKLLLSACFLLLSFQLLFSQKEANIWYFGNYAGLDFSSGSPVALTDGMLCTIEGCATISDSDGDLQFYTDGMTVYNKDHEIMQNGLNLNGNFSSSQSALIVPKPLSEDIYYIFTVAPEGGPAGFCYSEVDMTANGGLGKVTANKNIMLLPQSSEQLTAVGHANGIDIWVITHGHANNAYHSFLVTEDGVQEDPATSNTGFTLSAGAGAIGCMKVSPTGTKIASCHQGVGFQMADFNNATGLVSGGEALSTVTDAYGVEFSPSGNVLYMSREGQPMILQYDVTALDIPASELELPAGVGGALQLAPDGKIYKVLVGALEYLSVISAPDVLGTGCNVIENGVTISGPGGLGLPTFIQSFFASGIHAEHLCLGDVTEFSLLSPILPETITWNFGDGTTSSEAEPTHVYEATGTYIVSAMAVIDGDEKVTEKTITIFPLPVAHTPPDILACDDNADGQEVFDLTEQETAILGEQSQVDYTVTYYNSEEDAEGGINPLNENYTNISNPQTIYARVTADDSGCYAVTSFAISATHPVIDMPNEYLLCEGSTTTTINAPAGFISYLWSTGGTTASITVDEPGTYSVTVVAENEGVLCEASKTITVSLSPPPIVEDIIVQEWTNSQNSITVVPSGYEYSIDGIHYQDNPQFQNLEPGQYTVYIRDRNNCGTVEHTVLILMFPKFFTPNGDSHNETWKIRHGFYEPNMLVYVFDRYGKLLTSFKGNSPGWDGTFNGNDLPATDYWFVIKRQDGREYMGHFSLIR